MTVETQGQQLYPLRIHVFPSGTRKAPPIVVCTFNTSTSGRQRHLDLWEFKVSLIYIVSSKAAKGYIVRLF